MNIFGIISDERAYRSKSPAMHNYVFKKTNIEAVYVPFCVQDLQIENTINGIRALGIVGVNVTVPYKQSVIPYVDIISDEVLAIGAVNTIFNKDNKLYGYNTDASGLMDVFERNKIKIKDSIALVFGTGGASRAVLYALKQSGAKTIFLAGRNIEKTRILADEMSVSALFIYENNIFDIKPDIIINATSVSAPEESNKLAEHFDKMQVVDTVSQVIDINYGRDVNIWKNLASRMDARFMDGRSMLASQAARSFYIWTGKQVDVDMYMKCLL
jgi:shikimate dehydrogenase